jgi:hypothetical protein
LDIAFLPLADAAPAVVLLAALRDARPPQVDTLFAATAVVVSRLSLSRT